MRRTFVLNVYKPVLPIRPLATTGCLVTFLIFLLHSMPQIQMSTLSVRTAQEHTGALPPQSSGSQRCCGDPAPRFCVGIFTWTGFLLVCYLGYLTLRWGLTISLLWQEWVWICDSPGTLLAPASRVLWLPEAPTAPAQRQRSKASAEPVFWATVDLWVRSHMTRAHTAVVPEEPGYLCKQPLDCGWVQCSRLLPGPDVISRKGNPIVRGSGMVDDFVGHRCPRPLIIPI